MWEIIRANKRKSVLLVFVMALLLMVVGAVFGEYFAQSYEIGLLVAVGIWFFLSFLAYFQGRNLFLTISGAQKIKREDHPRLFNIVEEMKIASLLPAMPDIYIIDDPSANAFAVGQKPENAAVAVTSGLLNSLSRDELQGVIAHEVGHIINRDTLFMSMLGVMLGAIVMLAAIARRSLFMGGGRRRSRTSSSSGGGQAQLIIMVIGIVLMILAPVLARLIYLAASRKREYLADASAAVFTRYPEGLASALEKISVSPLKMRKTNQVTAPMYIINPIQKLKAGSDSLFSTHPSTRNRIQVLRTMAGGSGYFDYDNAFKKVTGQSGSMLPKSALSNKASKQTLRTPGGEIAKTTKTAKRDMVGMITGAVITGAILTDSIAEPATHVGKTRETTDAIWKSRGYQFINCKCGAILKVPPDYLRHEVKCLRCHTMHPVKKNPPTKQ
ncbi:M48 family metalloprotease [bacterium]|nr:M48 family metalloprotease [bacterium]